MNRSKISSPSFLYPLCKGRNSRKAEFSHVRVPEFTHRQEEPAPGDAFLILFYPSYIGLAYLLLEIVTIV